MDFALTDEQQQIREEVLKICARFDDTYWLERDRTATFPDAFFAAMANGNWLGIAMPEAYGGAGLGITERDWDTSVKHLTATLDKFSVPSKEKDEVLGAVSTLKKDIVEKP